MFRKKERERKSIKCIELKQRELPDNRGLREELINNKRKEPRRDKSDSSQLAPRELEPLELIVKQAVECRDTNSLFDIIVRLRAHLCEETPPIQAVIDAGLVPHLIQCLKTSHAKLHTEALWCLINIASGTDSQTRTIVEAGGLAAFLHFLTCPRIDVKALALQGIANIAGVHHLLVKRHLPVILSALNGANEEVQQMIAWTLSNLAHTGLTPAELALVLPPLTLLVHSPHLPTVADATWALAYLANHAEHVPTLLSEKSLLGRIFSFLSDDPLVAYPAFHMLGKLIDKGKDHHTDQLLGSGLLLALYKLSFSEDVQIRHKVCWVVSNLCGGTIGHLHQVRDMQFFERLVHLFNTDHHIVQVEAGWALKNILVTEYHLFLEDLGKLDLLHAYCSHLESADKRILTLVLSGLLIMMKHEMVEDFEEYKGVDRLETLLHHNSDEIVQQAEVVLTEYFGTRMTDAFFFEKDFED